MNSPRVTLLTDFGTRDGFVAAVKGMLCSLAPGAVLDDISHDLPAGDVRAAARALGRYWERYPPGTVHVIVVDPGVGTGRHPLACSASGRFLVGPDNGVLTPALVGGEKVRCVRIDLTRVEGVPGPVSSTFHGRDVFAPAAAALARGVSLDQLGDPVPDPLKLEGSVATRTESGADGVVVAVDRFGNLTTNVPGEWATLGDLVEVGPVRAELCATYGEVPTGVPVALVDSEGWLEVAVRDGSAARSLCIGPGDPVRLVRREGS